MGEPIKSRTTRKSLKACGDPPGSCKRRASYMASNTRLRKLASNFKLIAVIICRRTHSSTSTNMYTKNTMSNIINRVLMLWLFKTMSYTCIMYTVGASISKLMAKLNHSACLTRSVWAQRADFSSDGTPIWALPLSFEEAKALNLNP